MVLGINPLVDFAFKRIFGNPKYTNITVHYLNAVLNLPSPIASVTIRNPFLDKDADTDKLAVLDILAVDDQRREINIEVQNAISAALPKRLVYYAGRLYVDQLTEAKQYSEIRPAISICVLSRSMFPHVPDMHLDFQLRTKDGLTLTDALQIHLVELQKSTATEHNLHEVTPLERWAFFLHNAESMDTDQLRRLLPQREFAEALEVLEMIRRDPDEKSYYEDRLKAQRDERARLEFAVEEAVQKAEAKAREEGREEGAKIGRIRLLQTLIGIPESSEAELAGRSIEELVMIENELMKRMGSGSN